MAVDQMSFHFLQKPRPKRTPNAVELHNVVTVFKMCSEVLVRCLFLTFVASVSQLVGCVSLFDVFEENIIIVEFGFANCRRKCY